MTMSTFSTPSVTSGAPTDSTASMAPTAPEGAPSTANADDQTQDDAETAADTTGNTAGTTGNEDGTPTSAPDIHEWKLELISFHRPNAREMVGHVQAQGSATTETLPEKRFFWAVTFDAVPPTLQIVAAENDLDPLRFTSLAACCKECLQDFVQHNVSDQEHLQFYLRALQTVEIQRIG